MGTSRCDITTVRMEEDRSKPLVLSSIFLPYDDPEPPGKVIQDLVDELGSILGCDANAHHFHRGSSDTKAGDNSLASTSTSPTLTIISSSLSYHPHLIKLHQHSIISFTLNHLNNTPPSSLNHHLHHL
ncbi:uncharacterized protein [Musca autumnalis]|uniref:uncharacterized protein n=1 Tax=Musca autumnalis TaxID=221902 RepID=UPI003CEC35B4